MPADRCARELNAIAFAFHPHQSEVAGAASHIADQHCLSIEQLLVRSSKVPGNPGIEGGGRLFQQREICDPGLARRLHRQLSRLFVKAGWHREDHLLVPERRALFFLPGAGEVSEIAGGGFHWRKHAAFLL